MNYTQYKFARDLSWKILIRERVCALPVSMSRLCRQMGIEVKYDDKVRLDDGCGGMVLKKGRRYVIIVRRSGTSSSTVSRRRGTIQSRRAPMLLRPAFWRRRVFCGAAACNRRRTSRGFATFPMPPHRFAGSGCSSFMRVESFLPRRWNGKFLNSLGTTYRNTSVKDLRHRAKRPVRRSPLW